MREINKVDYALLNHLAGIISSALQIADDKTKVPTHLQNEHGVFITQFLFDRIIAGTVNDIRLPIDLQFKLNNIQSLSATDISKYGLYLTSVIDSAKYGLYLTSVVDAYILYAEPKILGHILKILYSIAPKAVL